MPVNNNGNEADREKTVSRRNVLTASAAAAAAAAGCLGGGGGDDDGGSETDGGDDGGSGDNGATESTDDMRYDVNDNEVHLFSNFTSETWVNTWDEERSAFESTYDAPTRYERAPPIGEVDQRLSQLISAGNPPEIWTALGRQFVPYILEDQIADVSKPLEKAREVNGEYIFDPDIINFDGSPALVPHGVYLSNGLWRTDIYDQLDLSWPNTRDGLLDNCQIIEEDSSINMDPLFMRASQFQSELLHHVLNSDGDFFGWESDDQERVEVTMDDMVTTMEYFDQCAEYTTAPGQSGAGELFGRWISGQYAQVQVTFNGWNIGAAVDAGVDAPASEANIGLTPKKSGAEPLDRGTVVPTGPGVFSGSDNPDGGRAFIEQVWGDSIEKTASLNAVSGARFVPAHKDVIEQPNYAESDKLTANDNTLQEVQLKAINELAPELENPERPRTLPAQSTLAAGHDDRAANRIAGAGDNPSDVAASLEEQFRTTLSEEQEKFYDS